MVKLILFNLADKYQYNIPLKFNDIDDYNKYCKSFEFYEFIIDLKDRFGRIYTMYDEEYGTDKYGIPYIKYEFNEQHDFKKSLIMWKRFFHNKNKIVMSKKTFRNVNINEIKLSLKFEFEKENNIKVKIIFVRQEYLKKDNFGIYRDYENDFSVWTCGTFLFDERQLRLPDVDNIKSTVTTSFTFKNEEQKKETLKKLYSALHHWSNKNSDFKDAGEVVLDDEYWYVI